MILKFHNQIDPDLCLEFLNTQKQHFIQIKKGRIGKSESKFSGSEIFALKYSFQNQN